MGFPSPAHVPSHFFQKPIPFRLSYPHFKPIVANMKSKLLPALHLLSFIFVPASRIHAADITWADSAGNTTWTTSNVADSTPASASWVGGFAPANSVTLDNAIFTSVSNAQPNLTVQTRITGVDFQMAAGGLAMTGNNNLLQLGTLGIDATGQTSGTNTITNTRIFLNVSSAWNLFSAANTASTSTFTFASGVDLNNKTLTIIGQRDSTAGNVGNINFTNAISSSAGTGAVTINSTSTNNNVTFSGTNTYTGLTTVSAGTVTVQNDQSAANGGWSIVSLSGSGSTQAATVSLSTGSTLAVASANKIQLGTTANSGTYANSTLNVAGTVTNSGALQLERVGILNLNSGAVWTQSGNLTVTARGGASSTLNVNAGSELTYSGSNTVKINSAGGSSGIGSLNIDGTGRFTTGTGFENLTTLTTGSGVSRVRLTNGGTLRLSADVTNLTTQTRFDLSTGGGVIDTNGFSTTLSGVTTVGSSSTAAGITGAGGLTKNGSGTLTLTGDNTYTGTTAVSAGTLVINGNISTSSLTTVAAAGTLGGSGTVGKTVINGTLAIGNSPGTMTFTDTLTLAGTTVMEIDGTSGAGVTGGHDFANLTGLGAAGELTYGGALTLDIGTLFGLGIHSWDLFDFSSETGSFSSVNLADQYFGSLVNTAGVWDLTSGNDTWQFTESTGVLTLNVVPEPSAALLGGLGMLVLLRRRRD